MSVVYSFEVVDYAIFAIVLLLSTIIGIVFGFVKRRSSSAQEMLVANRDMGVSSIFKKRFLF